MYVLNTAYGNRTFEKQIEIRSGAAFPLNPRSDVVYFIDGVVDFGSKPINVPVGGLFLKGHNLDLSILKSSEDNYTLFNSLAAGSIFLNDVSFNITGSESSVYGLKGATGFEVIEANRVNYNDCTSLGYIDNFLQGLETNVGRYGGKPELELRGVWGGFKSETTNTRSIDQSFTGSLFKAGAGLTFSSRFATNIKCDLPPNASFSDFSPSNFLAPSLLQVTDAIFSRNNIVLTGDNNFFPNLNPEDLACSWKNNNGIRNTREGGRLTISTEVTTSILDTTGYYDIDGTWTADALQHFSSSSNGQLQNDGTNPIEYTLFAALSLEGNANNSLLIRITRWDDANQVFVPLRDQPATVNSLSGPRDVAISTFSWTVTIEQNDYIKLQVRNLTSTNNVTAEIGSYFEVRL